MNNSIRKLIALLAIPSFAWLAYGQEASEGQESETGQPDSSGEAAMNEPADAAPRSDPTADEDLDRLFEGIDSDSLADDENGVGGEAESPLEMEMGLAETDTISVDFPNEEIRTVLRNVADLYGLNIVVPQTLQGTTSIKLRDVNWRQIFNTVLDPVGFTFASGRDDLFSPLRKLAWLTDLGFAPRHALERIRDVDTLIVESNHDTELLHSDARRPWSVSLTSSVRGSYLSLQGSE